MIGIFMGEMDERFARVLTEPVRIVLILVLQFFIIFLLAYLFRDRLQVLPDIYDQLQMQNVYSRVSKWEVSPTLYLISISLVIGYLGSILYTLTDSVRIFQSVDKKYGRLTSAFNILQWIGVFVLIPFYIYVALEDLRLSLYAILGLIFVGVVVRGHSHNFSFIPYSGYIKADKYGWLYGYTIAAVAILGTGLVYRMPPVYELIALLLINFVVFGLSSDIRKYAKRLISDYDFAIQRNKRYQKALNTDNFLEEYEGIEGYLEHFTFVVIHSSGVLLWSIPMFLGIYLIAFFFLNLSIIIALYAIFATPLLIRLLRIWTYTPPVYAIQLQRSRLNGAVVLEEGYGEGYVEVLHEDGRRRIFIDNIDYMTNRTESKPPNERKSFV
jgi:hypothetical protein